MEVQIVNRPSGLINGLPWPEVGETIDVPDVVAADLIRGGAAEAVKDRGAVVETATAPTGEVETATVPKRGRAKASAAHAED